MSRATRRSVGPALLVFLAVALLAPCARGATITVTPGGATTIQAAFDLASNGDTIELAEGTYTGSGNCNLNLTKELTVAGETGDPSDVMLDCNHDSQILNVRGTNAAILSATLSGLTFQRGRSTNGGGVEVSFANPLIENCRFQQNIADALGGGLFIQSLSVPVVRGCTFTDNTAEYAGSADRKSVV